MTEKAEELQRKKARGEKIVVLTCYDYPTALVEEAAGVDVVFVGDSLGTNVLGYQDEREVTMDDMIHHLKAVRRGVTSTYLLVDMPYQSCATPDSALDNALRFLSCGADGVKLEGFEPDIVAALSERQLDVWCHLGLTPQIHESKRLQATSADLAMELIDNAIALEAAGAHFIVIELVPEEVAAAATEKLNIPTIGIGAGAGTDGQVIVVPDLLGMTRMKLRHITPYEKFYQRSVKAVRAYAEDVRAGKFPGRENSRHLSDEETDAFRRHFTQ